MDAEFYNDLLTSLNSGLWMSLALIIPSALGGVVLGVVTGMLRTYGNPAVKWFLNAYAAIFRGTPLVIQLFTIYYALPQLSPAFKFSPYSAAVTGFILCSAAYQSEYVRGALLSIKKGQYYGAEALGFSGVQTIVSIIIPQAFRRALPGCGNEIVYLIKYSSLASIVTCMELTGEGKAVASEYYRFTEVFLVVGAYYLVLVSLAILLLNWLKKRLEIPGFGYSAE